LLNQLNAKYPNNAEQDIVYNYIKSKIDNLNENDPGTFIFINGPAGIITIITNIIINNMYYYYYINKRWLFEGSGKSTLCQKGTITL